MKIETIHVNLPEKGVDCWSPCRAEHLGGDLYRILDEAPKDPVWQFGKGDVVRCRVQKLSESARFSEELVAFERATLQLYPCPCCGYLVHEEPPGSYDICPICFWEDDLVQLRYPEVGGANHVSLLQAQQNFPKIGACEERILKHVRKPQKDEQRDSEWRPIAPELDHFERSQKHVSGMDYWEKVIAPNYPADTTQLYYWRKNYWRAGADNTLPPDYKTLMERALKEFDFKSWREWLRAKATELQKQGYETKFGCGPDTGSKPGMGLGIVGRNALGQFENWITGETDYTIHAPPGGPMVSHKWMQIVNDSTFEATFNEFISEFRKHDLAS